MKASFESKIQAIEEGRNYEGRDPLQADLLEDCNPLQSELARQKELIMLSLARNEHLRQQIKTNRTATANARRRMQEIHGDL